MNPRDLIIAGIFSAVSWLGLIAWAVATLTGCQSSAGVTLAPLPAWRAPADAAPIPSSLVAVEVGRLAPGAQLRFSDNTYSLVSKRWLDEYVAWTWDAALRAGVIYTPESFDCEDFSVLFAVLANRAAAKAGLHAAPLVARIVVVLPTSARHELIGVATDEGVFVVEPQPAAGAFRTKPLAEYKNRIQSVTLGDAP